MEDPLRSYPGYSLRRASVAVMGELSRQLDLLGLRFTESSVLLLVRSNPGITQSQLSRMLDIKRANMAPLVARLEDRKLLDRTPVDGRSHGLSLSIQGTELSAQVASLVEAFESKISDAVPAEHRAHLLPALSALWRAFGG